MSAAPNAVREFQRVGVGDVDLTPIPAEIVVDVPSRLTVKPKTTSAAIASNFKIIKIFWVVLPARTPRQLIKTRNARARAAISAAMLSLVSAWASAHKYFAKVTATAAIPPLWVTSSRAQP